jgi:predicted transposase/invertase (TIGR01784 family)
MRKKELENLVREFPDRSIRWLLETPDNVRGLLLVTEPELANHIDYKKLKRLDRTFILDNFRKYEADLVFIAPFSEKSEEILHEVIIYILIEHQTKIDPIMPFRVLSYMVHIWDMQRREGENKNVPKHQWRFKPVLPVILYTGSQQWDAPEMKHLFDLAPSLEPLIPQHKIFFLNLKSLEPKRLTENDNPFGWILRIMQKENATTDELGMDLVLSVERFMNMPVDEQANWEKLMHFLYAFIYHRRDESEHAKLMKIIEDSIVDQSKIEEVNKMSKTMAEVLIEQGIERGFKQGIEKGIQKGIEKGIQKGLYDTISMGLELKFGEDGIALMKRILQISSIKKLEKIKNIVRIAKDIDEVKKIITD